MRWGILTLAAAAIFLALAQCAGAAGEPGWLTGAELEKHLAAPVTISQVKVPLARALETIRSAQHLAIVLDRRVDPEQEIQLALSREPLRVGLERLAKQLRIGYCQLGPVAYLGPMATAARLRTLAALRLEDARALPPAVSRKFIAMHSMHWDDLAEPHDLVAELATEAHLKVVGAEQIPHDLWPRADLPPMSWIDRMTLVAAEFDLTFHVDKTGGQVALVAIPQKVTLARTYDAGRTADSLAKRWAKTLPNAQVSVEDRKIRVEGSIEDHEAVEKRLRGAPTQRTTVTVGNEVYQLTVEATALSQVLDQLAQRLSLELEIDARQLDAAGISLEQLVSVKVKDVTLDELLGAVLAGTGLTFRHQERRIAIYPIATEKR